MWESTPDTSSGLAVRALMRAALPSRADLCERAGCKSVALQAFVFCFIFIFSPAGLNAASNPNESRGSAPIQGTTPNPGYRLGANDVIRVQVFGEDALTTETRVSGDGKVALPLLGVLEIKGLTVKETEELITSRLADGYLKNPRVSIYIIKYRNFYVSGEVKLPGGIPYEEGLTVLKAVTLAGGFTEKASKAKITIKRLTGGNEEILPAALEDPVLPDDVLAVPQARFFVSGEVRTPGSHPYEEGLTVGKALGVAGGFTEKAAKSRIKVQRVKGTNEETVSVSLEDAVFPDDVLYVAQARNYYVTGEVKKPDKYPFDPEEGLTVLKAVTLAGGFTDKAAKGRIKIKRMNGKKEETVSVKLEDPVLPDDIIVVPESFF